MSVLIKGMKMPTEGRLMTIYKLQGKFYASQNTELCPIIELPDHGDLIERDALLDSSPVFVTASFGVSEEFISRYKVITAPVVIPEERSEDE